MATSDEMFQSLFERWKRENFRLTFYFDKIFDKALNKLIENTESDLADEIQSGKYKGLFCPVGYSIENIALIAAFIKPKFLKLAFSEISHQFHRKHFDFVKEHIKNNCEGIDIDDIYVIRDDQLETEQKIAGWIKTMKSKGFSLNQLAIDLTGGTKPMSIGAENAAFIHHINAFYLNAEYEKGTLHPSPIPGTEKLLYLVKRHEQIDENLVFVIMPFAKEFNKIFSWIEEIVINYKLNCVRADKETFTGVVMDRIKDNIQKSEIIIADLTNNNANVYYELGMAYSYNKNVILLKQHDSKLLFDIQHIRVVTYDKDNEIDLKKRLTEEIKYFKLRQN